MLAMSSLMNYLVPDNG